MTKNEATYLSAVELSKKVLEEADRVASDLLSWGETAVFDIAGDEIEADELWDDADMLRDLMGDRIFDSANEISRRCGGVDYKIPMRAICEAIKKNRPCHYPMVKAMEAMLRDHKA